MSHLIRIAIAGLTLATVTNYVYASPLVRPLRGLAAPPATVEVRNRGGAVAAGIVGGMILGGIIASQTPRYYGPSYYQAPPAYPYDPAVRYCMQRYRSYDPYSMSYLGNDGYRHPCP